MQLKDFRAALHEVRNPGPAHSLLSLCTTPWQWICVPGSTEGSRGLTFVLTPECFQGFQGFQ